MLYVLLFVLPLGLITYNLRLTDNNLEKKLSTFFSSYLVAPLVNFKLFKGRQPLSPDVNHCSSHCRGLLKPRSEVVFLSQAKCTVGFEPITSQFLV